MQKEGDKIAENKYFKNNDFEIKYLDLDFLINFKFCSSSILFFLIYYFTKEIP